MMDRRVFIVGGVTAFATPLAAETQPAKSIPRIGFLANVWSPGTEADRRKRASLACGSLVASLLGGG
jgi:hypothetical protein